MLLGFLTVVNTNKQLPLNVSNDLLNYAASPPRRPRSNYVYDCTFQQNRQMDKLNVSERNAQSNFQDYLEELRISFGLLRRVLPKQSELWLP